MLQAYSVILTPDENGYIVEFPDIPEAITQGRDIESALQLAQDALVVALSGYMDGKRPIPKPSKPKKGQRTVGLPPLAASKLAIYQAMLDNKITQFELAKRLKCNDRQVRRIPDLDHNSTLEQLDNALHAIGKKLVIDIQDEELAFNY